MGVREIQVADTTLVIHELEDVCDSVTGRVLTGSWLWNSSLVLSEWIATQGRLTFDFHDKTSSSEFYGFDFDLVLMSDVFFDMEEMAALAKTLKKVCRKETVVWAASEVRPWTGECLNVLVSEGFGVVEFPSQLGGSIGSGNPFMEEDSLDTFAVFLLLPPNEDSHVAAVCN
ncbi:hypothetical protein CFP56_006603 [Quercus suber]|uniref:Uncharacterized protein n=1 Tax=Quercus suber TaxID=58331 RepID=A0AAW0L8J8_QUESU